LKTDGVDRLVALVPGLRFTEMLGREAKPAYRLDEPVLARCNSLGQAGNRSAIGSGRRRTEDAYTLQGSLRPGYFRIDAATAKSLLDAVKRKSLIEPQSPA
jgi:hypothetical protein